MLSEKTKESLVNLGFDVEKLKDAITSEKEIELEVPTLYKEKGITNEEMTVFGKNRFEEGKKAVEEILSKQAREKFSLEVEEKDIWKMFEAYGEKRFKEANPGEELTKRQKDFKELQEKYSQLEGTLEETRKKHKADIFKSVIKQKLLSNIPKGVNLKSDDIVDLYLLRHSVEEDNGSAVIFENGEPVKDKLLNPVKVDDHFKGWLDSSGLIVKNGMGGSTTGGSANGKFGNITEFYEWCKANGKEPLSDEMQKYYLENKV